MSLSAEQVDYKFRTNFLLFKYGEENLSVKKLSCWLIMSGLTETLQESSNLLTNYTGSRPYIQSLTDLRRFCDHVETLEGYEEVKFRMATVFGDYTSFEYEDTPVDNDEESTTRKRKRTEKCSEGVKSNINIGTYKGEFKAAEVLACILIKYAKDDQTPKILRSNDIETLNACDILIGVGGVYNPTSHRYDHHQRTFDHSMNSLNKDYPWTIKLSSAGLIYFHFGRQIISTMLNLAIDSEEVKVLYNKVYENFILEIDGCDNGIDPCHGPDVSRYKVHCHLSTRVKQLNPAWNEKDPNETKCFEKACQLVEDEFLVSINYYGKIWLPARDIVKSAIEDRLSVHSSGEIIELNSGGCPWKEHLFELESFLRLQNAIKFVIYANATNDDWRVQCVSVSPLSFENRLSLRKEWCGLRDEELSQVSGINGCVFVHSSGFIGGNISREGALEMALKTLSAE